MDTLVQQVDELLLVIDAVLEWARTPGDHGGNPYCKDFVRLAVTADESATVYRKARRENEVV